MFVSSWNAIAQRPDAGAGVAAARSAGAGAWGGPDVDLHLSMTAAAGRVCGRRWRRSHSISAMAAPACAAGPRSVAAVRVHTPCACIWPRPAPAPAAAGACASISRSYNTSRATCGLNFRASAFPPHGAGLQLRPASARAAARPHARVVGLGLRDHIGVGAGVGVGVCVSISCACAEEKDSGIGTAHAAKDVSVHDKETSTSVWDIDIPWDASTIVKVMVVWYACTRIAGPVWVVARAILARTIPALRFTVPVAATAKTVIRNDLKLVETIVELLVLHFNLKPWYPLSERGIFRCSPPPGAFKAGALGAFCILLLVNLPVTIAVLREVILPAGGGPLLVALRLLAAGLYLHLKFAFGLLRRLPHAAASIAQRPVHSASSIFTSLVLAPVFEELLLRGFFLASLTKYVPRWAANGLSAIVFAALHTPATPAAAVPFLISGCVYGFLYTRSGSLASPIIAHALNNVPPTIMDL